MHLICPPKFCIIFVFHFSLGITAVPREIENNAYAKFWGAKKVHYGKCGSGVYGNSFYRLKHNFVNYLCFLAIVWTRERYDSMKMFTCFNLTSRVPKQSGMLSHCVVVRVTTFNFRNKTECKAGTTANQPFAVVPDLHSVLFYFTHQVTSGYSISVIRDPARGTSQFYLRVAWTSAFKLFFLFTLTHPSYCETNIRNSLKRKLLSRPTKKSQIVIN